MSSLRFTKAPPKPQGISKKDWEAEWVGLHVGLASVFPRTIGCLGENSPLVSVDGMNSITNLLSEHMWISREALVHSCKHSLPPRPLILEWLQTDELAGRDVFAVFDAVAEYLP